ncbi:MAG: hypothetical protein HOI66_00735, partial [Verrucomicrobia bacterium]|nr:hypothetical protein [Verrucomicrobiota bacterium]
YRDLLRWLATNGVEVNPWTTLDFEREAQFGDVSYRQSDLVDQIVNSDYVVVIAGESSIDPEGLDTQALNTAAWMKRPIIALNINQLKAIDHDHFPSLIADQLVLHIPMEGLTIKHALETWKDEAFRVRTMGQIGPVHYSSDVYTLIEERAEEPHPFESQSITPGSNQAETDSPWSQSAAA